MKYLSLLLWLLLSAGLGYVGHNGLTIGGKSIPGPGALLNPVSGLWKNAENADKLKDYKLKSPVESDIRIYYDDRLVPHIFANSIEDALYAQGYVEAANRLWQMDFLSREAAGQLSEVLGERTIRYDIRRRKQGLLYGAEIGVEQWKNSPKSEKTMTHYLDGVNAYIEGLKAKNYPIEFKLLGYKPKKWTALNSALILKSMTATLASFNKDILATNTLKNLGEENFEHLYPVIDPDQRPVIPKEKTYQFNNILFRDVEEDVRYDGPPLDDLTIFKGIKGIGSNNWAISPEKTAGSYPLLCNDPHLNLTLPSIWYEIHIVTPEVNAYGVTIPGMPGIMIGMNDHIAWGNTNVGHDFVDYYALDWADDDKTKYHIDGQVKDVELRHETINVKGEKPIEFDIKLTDFGLVYAESQSEKSVDIARDWIGYRKHELDETTVFVNIMKAKNYEQFKKASNEFFTPAQNFLYADKSGNVALRVNGNLPLKYKNEGRFVKKGNASKNLSKNYIPREHNPEIINPEAGYVSSANQVSTSEDYPYFYNGSFEEYRGLRINEVLDEIENADVEDMKELQMDVYSVKADYFLSLIMDGINPESLDDEWHRKIYNIISDWDCNYDKDNIAAKFFDTWISNYRRTFWQNYLKRDSLDGIVLPEDWMLIKKTRQLPEFTQNIINESFKNACQKFMESDLSNSWKEHRPKSIDHLLRIPAFSHTNLDVGGCGDVVNAISRSIGPSWRMIVELDEKVKAHAVFPGGQSGNPASPFYDDSMQTWIDGEYHKIDIYRNEGDLENNALYQVTLTPAKR